jgi:hypothetical protein
LTVLNPRILLARFREKARNRPLLFLGGAVVAGLAAGGALAPRVLGRVLSVGGGLAWKLAVLPMIKERVLSAVQGESLAGESTKEDEHEAERY